MTKPKKKVRTDMRIYLQIFHLKFERHLTYRQIALALDIGCSTVNDIVTRFNNLNMQWPLPDGVSLDDLDKALMPGRNYPTDRVLPNWLKIDLGLKRIGVTKQLLWQEYQADHGLNALGYTQFCNHYRAWKGQQRRSMRPVRSCLSTSVAQPCLSSIPAQAKSDVPQYSWLAWGPQITPTSTLVKVKI